MVEASTNIDRGGRVGGDLTLPAAGACMPATSPCRAGDARPAAGAKPGLAGRCPGCQSGCMEGNLSRAGTDKAAGAVSAAGVYS